MVIDLPYKELATTTLGAEACCFEFEQFRNFELKNLSIKLFNKRWFG
jgi:hypothetical protein